MTKIPTVKYIPEEPRDPNLMLDDGQIQVVKQSRGEMPHADDDERGDEIVAEDWNP